MFDIVHYVHDCSSNLYRFSSTGVRPKKFDNMTRCRVHLHQIDVESAAALCPSLPSLPRRTHAGSSSFLPAWTSPLLKVTNAIARHSSASGKNVNRLPSRKHGTAGASGRGTGRACLCTHRPRPPLEALLEAIADTVRRVLSRQEDAQLTRKAREAHRAPRGGRALFLAHWVDPSTEREAGAGLRQVAYHCE